MFPYTDKSISPPTLGLGVDSCDEVWQFIVSSEDRGSSSVQVPSEPVATDAPGLPVDSTQVVPAEPVAKEVVEGLEIAESPVVVTKTLPVPVQTEKLQQTDAAVVSDQNVENAPAQVTEELGRGHRKQVPSVRLKDYVAYNSEVVLPVLSTPHAPLPFSTESSVPVQGNSLYPLTNFVSDANFSPQHRVFLANITTDFEPRHFKEAHV